MSVLQVPLRAPLQASSTTGSAIPTGPHTYYVTASHRVTMVDWPRVEWEPYGTRHLRRAGDPRTACGVIALDWPIFWTLSVHAEHADACRSCRSVLAFGKQ